MKYKLLLLMLVLTASKTFSQTTFTFNGIGDWTNTANWSLGNYPGTTVDANEIVEIYGKVTVDQPTIITNNGAISSFSSANGDNSEINIFGGLVNNKNINFSRATITVAVGGRIVTNGTSELVITNSTQLTNTGRIVIFGGLISINSLSSSIINDGTGAVSNYGILKVLSGTFENKSTVNNSIYNNGMFEIANGNVINRGVFFNDVNGVLLNSKTFSNESTGRIDNSGQITVTSFGAAIINSGNLNNNKNISLQDSSKLNMAISSSIFTNQDTGIVVVSNNSSIENNSSDFSIRGGKVINGGTIDNNTSIFIGGVGELENNGTLNNNFGATINNFGRLSGINTVHSGSFTNGSILSPGNTNDATGLYKLDSFFTSYVQTVSGSLNIQLAGNVAGDNYDQVIVNRDATLNGTLNVSLLNGFEPNTGAVFTILREGRNLSGTFATVNLPILTGGKVWNAVEYNNTDGVRISVSTALSVSDIDNESLKFKIYPNPVTDKINVSGVSTISNASVHDFNGRRILETELSNVNSSIDLSMLPFGVYLLKIKGQTFKFVKI